MKKNNIQSPHEFSEIYYIKETIEKKYPGTRSMTEVRRVRWGFADFVPDLQEWLQNEGFVPIGLFKTPPVADELTNVPKFHCYACYHPQERIEALIYLLGSTAGFEFLRYNVDSSVTITTTDMRMLAPLITPDFYHRVGPGKNPDSLETLDDYFTVSREMLASLRGEPIPECGCLELNSEEFPQRYKKRYASLMKEVDQKIEAFLESTKPAGKRFYLLKFIPKDPMEEVLGDRIRRFEENKSDEKSEFSLDCAIDNVVYITYIKHLEFPGAIDPESYIQQGIDIALDYFFGNWWQEEDYVGLSEAEKNQNLDWFEPFINGLLFVLLSQQWQKMAKLCSWLNADIEIEGTEAVEKEVLLVFKLVASSQSPEPMSGQEEIRASIRKCRLKRPKLLLNIWDAIEAMDQKEFENSMKESLTHYLKSIDPNGKNGTFRDCVAKFQTVLCLVALKKGLAFPKLPEKLAASLVTRKTLGLE